MTPYPSYGSVLGSCRSDKTRYVASGKKRQRKQQTQPHLASIYEEKMKLLILGNHTCGNRGTAPSCAAYLMPSISSVHMPNGRNEPLSGQFFLAAQPPGNGDPLFLQMKKHNSAAGVVGRLKKSSVTATSTRYCSHASPTWQAA